MAYFKIKKFSGLYTHLNAQKNNLQNIQFLIETENPILYLINPIQNIKIKIKRKSIIDDKLDWDSVLYSDILNIFHFKGPYLIKLKNCGGEDGWFDLYLFDLPVKKIALHLHYINDKVWVENEGYIIEKS